MTQIENLKINKPINYVIQAEKFSGKKCKKMSNSLHKTAAQIDIDICFILDASLI